MPTLLFQETPARGPWGSPEPEPEDRGGPVHEPFFNAPWPALLLVAVIVGGYAVQSRFPPAVVLEPYAFSPAGLQAGQWQTLVTAVFLHGNWTHALMNAAFGLAFATPTARFFGTRGWGVVVFFLFYLTCGVLSSLGFAALHWGGTEGLVGASGAISGLMGAASRLIAGQGRVGRIFSSPVMGMGAAWIVVNLLVGVLGSGWAPGTGGAVVAWEAHVAGFIAGVLLIGPFAWIARRS
jgi:membrane associated rhomboid family serine protease